MGRNKEAWSRVTRARIQSSDCRRSKPGSGGAPTSAWGGGGGGARDAHHGYFPEQGESQLVTELFPAHSAVRPLWLLHSHSIGPAPQSCTQETRRRARSTLRARGLEKALAGSLLSVRKCVLLLPSVVAGGPSPKTYSSLLIKAICSSQNIPKMQNSIL